MQKPAVSALVALFALSSVTAFASTFSYRCDRGATVLEITIDKEHGEATFSDGSALTTEGRFICTPQGYDGRLYADGASFAWGYRLPQAAFDGVDSFMLQYVWNDDGVGLACQYEQFKCLKN